MPPRALSRASSAAERFRPSTRVLRAAAVAAAASAAVHHLPWLLSVPYRRLLGHCPAQRMKNIV